MKRIISSFCVFAILLSTFSPLAFADDDYTSSRNLWGGICYGLSNIAGGLEVIPVVGQFGKFFTDNVANVLSFNQVCSLSPDDGLHHADHIIADSYGSDSSGEFVKAHCKYCGSTFKCYAEDLQKSYSDNYSNLGSYNVNNGSLSGYFVPNQVAIDDFSSLVSSLDYNISITPYGSDYFGVKCLNPKAQAASLQLYSIFVPFPDYASSVTFTFEDRASIPFLSNGPAVHGIDDLSTFSMWDDKTILSRVGGSLNLPYSTTYARQHYNYIYLTPSTWALYSCNSGVESDETSSNSGSATSNFFAWKVRYTFNFPQDYRFDTPIPNDNIINIDNTSYNVESYDFNTMTYNVTNNEGDKFTIKYDNDNYSVTNKTTNVTNNYYYNYITSPDTPDNPPSGGGDSGDLDDIETDLDVIRKQLNYTNQLLDQISNKIDNIECDHSQSDYLLLEIHKKLTEMSEKMNESPDSIEIPDYSDKLNIICNQLANIWGDVKNISGTTVSIDTKIDSVNDDLQAILTELQDQRTLWENVVLLLGDIDNTLNVNGTFYNAITTGFANLQASLELNFKSLLDSFNLNFDSLIDSIELNFGDKADFSGVESRLDAIITILGDKADDFYITSQPDNVTVLVGDTFKMAVSAVGKNLKYQWYFSKDDGATWKKSSMYTTPSFSAVATSAHNGNLYKCEITDESGNVFMSDFARVTIAQSPDELPPDSGDTSDPVTPVTPDYTEILQKIHDAVVALPDKIQKSLKSDFDRLIDAIKNITVKVEIEDDDKDEDDKTLVPDDGTTIDTGNDIIDDIGDIADMSADTSIPETDTTPIDTSGTGFVGFLTYGFSLLFSLNGMIKTAVIMFFTFFVIIAIWRRFLSF